MNKDINQLFVLAAKHFFKEYKAAGRSQKTLAMELGVTQPFLSSVINGSRSASLDLLTQIADRLYGPFDQFLAVGRRIKNGLDPLIEQKAEKEEDEVEILIAHLTHYVMHHKKIEQMLEISQEKYKDICLFTGDIIVELDADLRVTFVSGKVKELLGKSPHELLGKKPFDIANYMEAQKVKEAFDEAIRNRTIININIRDLRDGRTCYRNFIGKPLFSADKDTFIGIRGISNDITEKMEMQNALDDQIWLFQSAIDAFPEVGVVITDKDDRVLKWNAEYQNMYGFTTEVLETRDVEKYFSYLKKKGLYTDPEKVHKGVEETLTATGETVREFNMKDGRTIRRKSKPIYKNGEFAGRVHFIEDMTANKRESDSQGKKKK